jgi:hypothetical protein
MEGTHNTDTNGFWNHVEGLYNVLSSSTGSHMEGFSNTGTNSFSHTEGLFNINQGYATHIEGYSNNSSTGTTYSHIEGIFNIDYSFTGASITGPSANHIEGINCASIGLNGHAEGYGSLAGNYGHAEGYQTIANACLNPSYTINSATTPYFLSQADGGPILRLQTFTSSATGSEVIFSPTNSIPWYASFITGSSINVNGWMDVTLANGSLPSSSLTGGPLLVMVSPQGLPSHSEGQTTYGLGNYAHVEGQNTVVYGSNGHSEGQNNVCFTSGHVEGNTSTITTGHSEGILSLNFARSGHIEGKGCNALPGTIYLTATGPSGNYYDVSPSTSVYVPGNQTAVFNTNMIVSFQLNNINYMSRVNSSTAIASSSITQINLFPHLNMPTTSSALGPLNIVGGFLNNIMDGNHAEGSNTSAPGSGSHAEGLNTIASSAESHAEGAYSITNGSYAHSENLGTLTYPAAGHSEGNNSVVGGYTQYPTTTVGNYWIPSPTGTLILQNNVSPLFSPSTVFYFGASFGGAAVFYVAVVISSTYNAITNQTVLVCGNVNGSYLPTAVQSGTNYAYLFNNYQGQNAHAEGLTTQSYGLASHSEGTLTIAGGDYSHTEGQSTSTVTTSTMVVSPTGGNYYTFVNISTGLIYVPNDVRNIAGNSVIFGAYRGIVIGAVYSSSTNLTQITLQANAPLTTPRTLPTTSLSTYPTYITVQQTGTAAHAEGFQTIANGNYSHAEGQVTKTTGYTTFGSVTIPNGGNYLNTSLTGSATGTIYTSGNTTSLYPVSTVANPSFVTFKNATGTYTSAPIVSSVFSSNTGTAITFGNDPSVPIVSSTTTPSSFYTYSFPLIDTYPTSPTATGVYFNNNRLYIANNETTIINNASSNYGAWMLYRNITGATGQYSGSTINSTSYDGVNNLTTVVFNPDASLTGPITSSFEATYLLYPQTIYSSTASGGNYFLASSRSLYTSATGLFSSSSYIMWRRPDTLFYAISPFLSASYSTNLTTINVLADPSLPGSNITNAIGNIYVMGSITTNAYLTTTSTNTIAGNYFTAATRSIYIPTPTSLALTVGTIIAFRNLDGSFASSSVATFAYSGNVNTVTLNPDSSLPATDQATYPISVIIMQPSTLQSGIAAHAQGFNTIANGNYSHAEGQNTSTNGIEGAHIMGKNGAVKQPKSGVAAYSWSLAGGVNGVAPLTTGIAITLSSNGPTTAPSGYGNATQWNTSGADYAEMCEWADENLLNQDRYGYFVTFTGDADSIDFATSDNTVDGITSAMPGILGDSAWNYWHDTHLTDSLGRRRSGLSYTQAYNEYLYSQGYSTFELNGTHQGLSQSDALNLFQTNFNLDAPTMLLLESLEPVQVLLLNPNWNPTVQYIPRIERKEWIAVGFLGKLNVYDDGTCIPGQKCSCTIGGRATAGTSWKVLERIDTNVVRILFK